MSFGSLFEVSFLEVSKAFLFLEEPIEPPPPPPPPPPEAALEAESFVLESSASFKMLFISPSKSILAESIASSKSDKVKTLSSPINVSIYFSSSSPVIIPSL